MTTRSMIGVLAAATLAVAPYALAQEKTRPAHAQPPQRASEPAPHPAMHPRAASEPAPAQNTPPGAHPAEKPATGAGMAAPKPAAEMAQLKFFDGSWACTGDVPASPMGPAMKTKSTVKSHTAMGGFWQAGSVSMTSPAMSMEGMFHITYDPGPKQYVMLWIDNMGGYAQQMSTGWEGDKLVFTGEGTMGGQKMQARDTFARMADGSLKHSSEVQMNGQWTPMGEETCKKAAAVPAKK